MSWLTRPSALCSQSGKRYHKTWLGEDVVGIVITAEGDVAADVQVKFDGERLPTIRAGSSPRRTAFVGLRRALGQSGELVVRAATGAGRRLRVSVMILFRSIGAAVQRLGSKMSCNGCQRLVRMTIAAILATVGVPDIPWDAVVTDPELLERIKALASGEGLPPALRELLKSAGLEGVLDALLAALNELTEPLSRVAQRVCRALGSCP
jgi:hypothetical protein